MYENDKSILISAYRFLINYHMVVSTKKGIQYIEVVKKNIFTLTFEKQSKKKR